jgi:hypothetical protein
MASTLISLSSLALPLRCLHFIRSVSLTLDAVLLANDIGSSDASPCSHSISDRLRRPSGRTRRRRRPLLHFHFSPASSQPCRLPIRHNSKMLHLAPVARGLAGESVMPCEALCTRQLHGIVTVRPSCMRLQYCLEVYPSAGRRSS